jgi:hypothetical protein
VIAGLTCFQKGSNSIRPKRAAGSFVELIMSTRAMARVLKPISIAFEIVFDEDQAKLGGLPVFGFAARMYYMRDCYKPPDEDLDETET